MTGYYVLDAVTHFHALELCDPLRSLPSRDHYVLRPRRLSDDESYPWNDGYALVIDTDSGKTQRFAIEFKEPE